MNRDGKCVIVLSSTTERAEHLANLILNKVDRPHLIGIMSMRDYIEYYGSKKDDSIVLIIDDMDAIMRDYLKAPYITTMSTKDDLSIEELKRGKPLGLIEDLYNNLLSKLCFKGESCLPSEYEIFNSTQYDLQESPESEIASILVNGGKRVVTVTFADGDVRMSKCSEKDEFDVKVGVALCILYHMFGSSTKASKVIEQKAKFVTKKKKEEPKVKVTKGKVKVNENK